MTTAAYPTTQRIANALSHYHEDLQRAAAAVRSDRPAHSALFTPAFELPELTPALESYYAASSLGLTPLGKYRDTSLTLLNLMGNPGTRTTKTFASLLMVARAVNHIQQTGEPIMMLTPSSANKATALRDAVLRAVECGLVTPDQLRITVVVPEASRAKLWSSPLSGNPQLAERNPVLVYSGGDRAGVKALARTVVEDSADEFHSATGFRLWYSLDIDNYRMADAVRAFFEHEHAPETPGRSRMHAHAVSSAFGLLGHHLGHRLSPSGGRSATPRYFLVQHLDTPDMVLSLYFDSTSRDSIPAYRYDDDTGLFRQSQDPRFPSETYDPVEVLDPTFYTRQPPTSVEMNSLIRAGGGGGIVVSLYECLQRYPYLRALLAPAGVHLPADPRRLREWSLVMGATGVLNAVDRGLIDADEILLHGSGCFSDADYLPLLRESTITVTQSSDVRKAVFGAAQVDPWR